MVNAVHISSKSEQSYTTPPELVQFLERRFGVRLVIDLAASQYNSRCPRMISKEMDESIPDGVNWAKAIRTSAEAENAPDGAGWLNPPFKKATPFMRRAALAGEKIITLTLVSLDSDWYRLWVQPFALSLILEERVRFVGQPDDYPKALMVSLYGFGLRGLGWLSWKKEAYETYAPPRRADQDPDFIRTFGPSWEPGSGGLIQQGTETTMPSPLVAMPEGI